MESKEVVDKILHVKAWAKRGVRAPHKPLLLLYALAKFLEGKHELSYADLESDLKNLLSDFGPPVNRTGRLIHSGGYKMIKFGKLHCLHLLKKTVLVMLVDKHY